MSKLQDALGKSPYFWSDAEGRVIVEAARRQATGRTKPAIRIASNDGTDYWVATWIVDGPGDYTLLTPPGDD